eukprot:jgi/Astpho2/4489/Aster-x1254
MEHALIRSHGLAVDISEHAVEATCGTLLAHDVATVDVMQGDLRSCLTAAMAGKFDLLVCNPPYVPTPEAEVSRGDIAAAWAGGDRGRNVLDSLLPLGKAVAAVMQAKPQPDDVAFTGWQRLQSCKHEQRAVRPAAQTAATQGPMCQQELVQDHVQTSLQADVARASRVAFSLDRYVLLTASAWPTCHWVMYSGILTTAPDWAPR